MSVIKHEAFLSAEEGTEVDALVRTEVVEDGAREDGLDGLVGALLVVAVVVKLILLTVINTTRINNVIARSKSDATR